MFFGCLNDRYRYPKRSVIGVWLFLKVFLMGLVKNCQEVITKLEEVVLAQNYTACLLISLVYLLYSEIGRTH